MAQFDYIAVIVSVIIGLGLTRILQGVEALLKARGRVRLYGPHALFTLVIFLGHLQFWWLFWSSRDVKAWSFFPFLFLLAQPVVLYLLAGLSVPETRAEGAVDLRRFYYGNRVAFFACLALLMALISLRDLAFGHGAWPSPGIAIQLGVFAIGVTGIVSARPGLHWALAFVATAAMLAGLITFGLALED